MSTTVFDDDGVNDDELLAAFVDTKEERKSIEKPIDSPPISVDSFGFPFPPYPIQVEFMQGLYSTLKNRQHGIFESPTGTVSLFNESFADFLFRY